VSLVPQPNLCQQTHNVVFHVLTGSTDHNLSELYVLVDVAIFEQTEILEHVTDLTSQERNPSAIHFRRDHAAYDHLPFGGQ